MKKHHHILRTMKKTFREEEQRHNKQYSQSETFFQRLVTRMRNTDAEDTSEFSRDDMHITNPLQNPVAAAKKAIDIPIQKWMKQRGVFNQADKKFSDIAKELFKMLDVNNAGFLRGKELVKEVMELGVVTQPQVISDSLMTLFNTKDLHALKLSLDDFRALLRGDSKTDHMLDRLNQDAVSYKKKLDEKKSSFLVSYDAGTSVLNAHKRSISNSEAAPLHILKVDVGSQSEVTKSITFKDLHSIVDKWWSDLNTLRSNQVHINPVCDKLVQLEMIGDRKEGRKYIESMIGNKHHIDNIAFHRIFLRCFLKDLVYLSAEKFATTDPDDLLGKYAITKFKRELIQAGLKMNSDSISYDDGHAAIHAIERYHNFINEPIPQTDFNQFKQDWVQSTGKPYIEMVAEYSIESAPDILKSVRTSKKKKSTHKKVSGETPGSMRDYIKIQPKFDLDKELPILSLESKPSHQTSQSPSPLPNYEILKQDTTKVKTLQQARKDIVASPGVHEIIEDIPTIQQAIATNEQLPRQPSTKVFYEPGKNTSFTITAVRPGSPSRLGVLADLVEHKQTSNSSVETPNFLSMTAIKSIIRTSPNLNANFPFPRGSPVSISQVSPQKRIITGIKEKPDPKVKPGLKGRSFAFNPERTPPKAEYLFDRDYREFKLEQQNKLYEDFQNQIHKHV